MTPYRTPDLDARAHALREQKAALATQIQNLETRLGAAMVLYDSRARASVPDAFSPAGAVAIEEARAMREAYDHDPRGFLRGLIIGGLVGTVISLVFWLAA